MKNDFCKLIRREIRMCLKNLSILFSFSTFFIIASLIFVFALNDLSNLEQFYKPIIWIVLIFSIMLVSENFLSEDFKDGSLKELQFLGFTEEIIILCKSISMWVMIVLPTFFLMPIIQVFFQLTFFQTLNLFINIVFASPSLILISILSSLFSVQLKSNRIIQFVVIFPFFIPMIIFTGSSDKFLEDSNYNLDQFLILIGIFFITLPICLFTSKLIIREINK